MEQAKKIKVVNGMVLNENGEPIAEISTRTTTDFTLQMKTTIAPKAADMIKARQVAVQKTTTLPEPKNKDKEGDASK